ncbi:Regulator of chromosome condensation (RCC1) repeat protein [compost metagenome]
MVPITLALASDGMLFSWGMNSVGQLGDGTFINRDRPVVVNIDPHCVQWFIHNSNCIRWKSCDAIDK